MSEYPNFYVSRVLTAEHLRTAIIELPVFLKSELEVGTILVAIYGYGCKLHPSACYHNMEVGISWVDRFIDDSLRQEIVIPGNSDFSIVVPDDRMTLQFCHEGHIHTGGNDLTLQKRLWATKPFQGFPLDWSEGKRLH